MVQHKLTDSRSALPWASSSRRVRIASGPDVSRRVGHARSCLEPQRPTATTVSRDARSLSEMTPADGLPPSQALQGAGLCVRATAGKRALLRPEWHSPRPDVAKVGAKPLHYPWGALSLKVLVVVDNRFHQHAGSSQARLIVPQSVRNNKGTSSRAHPSETTPHGHPFIGCHRSVVATGSTPRCQRRQFSSDSYFL